MDIVTYALCRKMIKELSPTEAGVFHIQGSVESVAELPEEGNQDGDLYLVGPQEDESYDEYYWLEGQLKWELLGSTNIDLSDYMKKGTLFKIVNTLPTGNNIDPDVIYLIKNGTGNQYNQYIYKENNWLLIGDGGGNSLTYSLSKSGSTITLTDSNGGSSYVTVNEFSAADASTLANKIDGTEKGANDGVATLDSNGKIPSSQIPNSVYDTIEGYYYNGNFYEEDTHTTLITGETGKIYIDIANNSLYRYNGSTYIAVGGGSLPNATSTVVGGIKIRFDSTTGSLYITNDGTDA